MRLKREYFIIMWAHWKIHFLGKRVGEVTIKLICRGNCLKVGLAQFADLKEGGLAKESNALCVDY